MDTRLGSLTLRVRSSTLQRFTDREDREDREELANGTKVRANKPGPGFARGCIDCTTFAIETAIQRSPGRRVKTVLEGYRLA